jgi:ADP-ribose pyrophosphatase
VPGERHLDDGELIDLCLMTEEELDALAAAGALTDAKTLIGLQWLQKWRRSLAARLADDRAGARVRP